MHESAITYRACVCKRRTLMDTRDREREREGGREGEREVGEALLTKI